MIKTLKLHKNAEEGKSDRLKDWLVQHTKAFVQASIFAKSLQCLATL